MKKGKGKALANYEGKKKVADKGKCFHCNEDKHQKRNYLKYLVDKKGKKENQGKYDLLVVETCLLENDKSTWILD